MGQGEYSWDGEPPGEPALHQGLPCRDGCSGLRFGSSGSEAPSLKLSKFRPLKIRAGINQAGCKSVEKRINLFPNIFQTQTTARIYHCYIKTPLGTQAGP